MLNFKRSNFNFDVADAAYVEPRRFTRLLHSLRKNRSLLKTAETLTKDVFDDADRGEAFCTELYTSLYEADEARQVAQPQQWASTAFGLAEDLPEWQEVLTATRGDADLSAIASAQIQAGIRDLIAEMQRQEQEHNEQQQQEQQGAGMGAAGGAGEGSGDGDGAAAGAGVQEIADGDGDGTGDAQGWQPTQEQIEELRRAMRNACSNASKQCDEVKDALKGCGKGVTAPNYDDEDRMKLAEELHLNPTVNSILRLAGRMQMNQAAKPAPTTEMGYEMVDVTCGNDIQNVLHEEIALLSIPALAGEFYRKFADEQLLQTVRKGKMPQGRGPAVICLDRSSSMSGDDNTYAAAFTIACVNRMIADKRDAYVVEYNGGVTYTTHVTKWGARQAYGNSTRFGGGLSTGDAIMHIARGGVSGGTSFNAALTQSLKLLKDEQRADIVFITDGHDRVSEDILNQLHAAKEQYGARTFGVTIGARELTWCDESVACEAGNEEQWCKVIGKARQR